MGSTSCADNPVLQAGWKPSDQISQRVVVTPARRNDDAAVEAMQRPFELRAAAEPIRRGTACRVKNPVEVEEE
jgi:hypothetical protein